MTRAVKNPRKPKRPALVTLNGVADGAQTNAIDKMKTEEETSPALTTIMNDVTDAIDKMTTDVAKINIQDVVEANVPEVVEIETADVATVKTEIIDWEKESKGLDEMFEEQAKNKLSNLPKIQMSCHFNKSVKLFKHQSDGIRWLVSQERGGKPSPFVYEKTLKDGSIAHYCKLTKYRLHKLEPLHGCILADEMGTGKTIQSIGLILTNPAENDEPMCTLIVCPKSVISNWVQQIKEHVKSGILNVKLYEGSTRSKMIPELMDANNVNVLIVSYETLAADFKRFEESNSSSGRSYTLLDVTFHRMILDEAHTVRNANSKSFKAVAAIKTTRKLCLTGTPFVNRPDDIFSLLKIINLQPLAQKDTFQQVITDPIMQRKRAGLTRLRTAMAYVALRRTKRVTDIELVKKEVQIRRIDWNDGPHKNIHDVLFSAAQTVFGSTLKAADDNENKSDIFSKAMLSRAMFEMLLRVRQACCHGKLVPQDVVTRAEWAMAEMEAIGSRELTLTEGCTIIQNLMTNEVPELLEDSSSGSDLNDSPKIQALFEAIDEMEVDEKGIIFSQWTSFLDIIESAAKSRGHSIVRIDGAKTTEQRIEAMDHFKNNDEVRLILCSLKAAGTGINLTRGNVVFMMDVWWNEAAENQAMDRCHRVGQDREVRCVRFMMKDSIEERMHRLQQAKAALGKGSLERISREEEGLAKMSTLKDLFQLEEDTDEQFVDWQF